MASILFPAHCCGCADYSVDATMPQHEVPLPNLRRKKLDHNRITAEVANNVQPLGYGPAYMQTRGGRDWNPRVPKDLSKLCSQANLLRIQTTNSLQSHSTAR
jgi:hypothetical protein